jgi:hypothetical protein
MVPRYPLSPWGAVPEPLVWEAGSSAVEAGGRCFVIPGRQSLYFDVPDGGGKYITDAWVGPRARLCYGPAWFKPVACTGSGLGPPLRMFVIGQPRAWISYAD